MAPGEHVPLSRSFSRILERANDVEYDDTVALNSEGEELGWDSLEEARCSVILAGAGVGKTHEMRERAKLIENDGKYAFFIRIERIEKHFPIAFDVGDRDQLTTWVSSDDEAWIFLDSVDEARLKDSKSFEIAIKIFSDLISDAIERSHIIISSRPYAWRHHMDREIIKQNFKLDKSEMPENYGVYNLNSLSESDIREFSRKRKVENIDKLVDEIRKKNIFSIASRPFDLENLLIMWNTKKILEDRMEIMRFGIEQRISEIDRDRDEVRSLNKNKALKGARSIAAAIIFTGEMGVYVPDSIPQQGGIKASEILSDWDPIDVNTLLGRGVFDKPLYGMVNFRHREILELLAAEWLSEGLKRGNSRNKISNLLFRDRCGHRFIVPRLRPLLPWLVLLDDEIYLKAEKISPGIVLEGGDAARLSLFKRREILHGVIESIIAHTSGGSFRIRDAAERISQADLWDDVRNCIELNWENDDVLFFLMMIAWQGDMKECFPFAMTLARNKERSKRLGYVAINVIGITGSRRHILEIWDHLLDSENAMDRHLLDTLIQFSHFEEEFIERIIVSISKLDPSYNFEFVSLEQSFRDFIKKFETKIYHHRSLSSIFLNKLSCLNITPSKTKK